MNNDRLQKVVSVRVGGNHNSFWINEKFVSEQCEIMADGTFSRPISDMVISDADSQFEGFNSAENISTVGLLHHAL